MTFDATKLRMADYAIAGLTLLFLVLSFFTWYDFGDDFFGIDVSISGWTDGQIKFAFFLFLLATAWALLPAVTHLEVGFPRSLVTVGLAALGFLLTLFAWFDTLDLDFSVFALLGMLTAAAILAFAVLSLLPELRNRPALPGALSGAAQWANRPAPGAGEPRDRPVRCRPPSHRRTAPPISRVRPGDRTVPAGRPDRSLTYVPARPRTGGSAADVVASGRRLLDHASSDRTTTEERPEMTSQPPPPPADPGSRDPASSHPSSRPTASRSSRGVSSPRRRSRPAAVGPAAPAAAATLGPAPAGRVRPARLRRSRQLAELGRLLEGRSLRAPDRRVGAAAHPLHDPALVRVRRRRLRGRRRLHQRVQRRRRLRGLHLRRRLRDVAAVLAWLLLLAAAVWVLLPAFRTVHVPVPRSAVTAGLTGLAALLFLITWIDQLDLTDGPDDEAGFSIVAFLALLTVLGAFVLAVLSLLRARTATGGRPDAGGTGHQQHAQPQPPPPGEHQQPPYGQQQPYQPPPVPPSQPYGQQGPPPAAPGRPDGTA